MKRIKALTLQEMLEIGNKVKDWRQHDFKEEGWWNGIQIILSYDSFDVGIVVRYHGECIGDETVPYKEGKEALALYNKADANYKRYVERRIRLRERGRSDELGLRERTTAVKLARRILKRNGEEETQTP